MSDPAAHDPAANDPAANDPAAVSPAASDPGAPERARTTRPRGGTEQRQHGHQRFRRRGRRAYIRSVYFLPSLATLGNAVCGFGAMYVSALEPGTAGLDRLTNYFSQNSFSVAAYLIFGAMIFDALDGRLARFTRHTTDFGGQLDSLADVISFGAAPAYLALQAFKHFPSPLTESLSPVLSRLIWAIGALFLSCAAMRLARFNVSNEHGEQHHFSFLGLPSPGAGGAVAGLTLMQQDLFQQGLVVLSTLCTLALPIVVLATGLLMVSNIRYPHLVNRYLRGRRSIARVLFVLVIGLLLVVWHQYTLGIGTLVYAAWGPATWLYARARAAGTPLT